GSTSGLAKALIFQSDKDVSNVLHQADWIAGQFCGTFSSDANNALKTGFDPVGGEWPAWMSKTGLNVEFLPKVHAPGTPIGGLLPDMAAEFDLPLKAQIVAGTTDGCASFLATGAELPGDGVSALGTTLTIKILSDKPIFDPSCGIYSHYILGNWLAGGASNTGGNVLLAHFTPDEMAELSVDIDPSTPAKFDYYPLVKPGERFPIADPALAPRMSPVPENRSEFLKELFEGIAGVEACGYSKLAELGAPKLTSVRSVGGGALDVAFSAIRRKRLAVPFLEPASSEAAYGAARLARYGMTL
ncbi:MAG: carbohydrate kinase, partial [Hyphomicrobiales bacterium]